MTDASSDFGFAFEKQGLGKNEGPVDPSEEYFTGEPTESLVRETIQNSLDAKSSDTPVRVVFELRTISTADVPDVETLRSVVSAAIPEYAKHQGAMLLTKASEDLEAPFVDVLRIGDYGTTGLEGSETLADSSSPLSALTRGSGVSSNEGDRGGSFGIGSKAGLAASSLRTVFFNSRTSETEPDVFAGYSRHASFTDPADGERRVASGYYRDRRVTDDFNYLRGWTPFQPFEPRSEPGTDLYVMGYKDAANDPRLHDVRVAAARHFLVAIQWGRLVVQGVTDEGTWTLDSHNLEDFLKSSEDLRASIYPFLVALKDPEPYRTEHPELGELVLFVNEDDTLDRSLWTWAMRGRLMYVTSYKHTGISVPYAAIFVATSEIGNAKLRALEPPQHSAWEPKRAPGGNRVVDAVKAFIREGLRAKIKVQAGKRTTIRGLAKYLPSDSDLQRGRGEGHQPQAGNPSDVESGALVGADGPETSVDIRPREPVRVKVERPAVASAAGESARRGKTRGGSSKRAGGGTAFDTSANDDTAGESRIPRGAVSSRVWQVAPGVHRIVLRSADAVNGDLALEALDADGTPIEGYGVDIVWAKNASTGAEIASSLGQLKGIDVIPGHALTIELKLASTRRIRMGVGS